MPFTKGKSGNPAGKPKGTQSKNPMQLRERIKLILDNNMERLQEDLDGMDSVQRWALLERLFAYSLPKLSATMMDISVSGQIQSLPPEQIDTLFQQLLNQQNQLTDDTDSTDN